MTEPLTPLDDGVATDEGAEAHQGDLVDRERLALAALTAAGERLAFLAKASEIGRAHV